MSDEITATPVVASTPSSATEAPAPVVEESPLKSFEDEVKALVKIVESGAILHERGFQEAIDRVKSFFSPDENPAETEAPAEETAEAEAPAQTEAPAETPQSDAPEA